MIEDIGRVQETREDFKWCMKEGGEDAIGRDS